MKAQVTIGKKSITCNDALMETLLWGGVVTVGALSPLALGALGAALAAGEKYSGKKLENSIQYQKRRGRIKTVRIGSKVKIVLTSDGKKYAQSKYVDKLKREKSKEWDGKWRIAIFDLDESKKVTRNMLRSRLKALEYVQLQRSVWISPYDTTDEVEQIQKKFQLNSDEFRLLEADTIGKDLGLRKHFDIKKR